MWSKLFRDLPSPSTSYSPVSGDEKASLASSGVSGEEEPIALIAVRKRLIRLSHIIYILFAIVLFMLGIFASPFWNAWQQTNFQQRVSPLPDFLLETMVYIQDPAYTDPPSETSDKLWMDLLGPTYGFITFDDPQEYDLPSGIINADGTQNYGISVFHQLHCVMLIRGQYFSMLDGKMNLTAYRMGSDPALSAEIQHVQHCYDYLRQTIMCSGDMTIEWPKDPHSRDVNGELVPHQQCKSWVGRTRLTFCPTAMANIRVEHNPEVHGGSCGEAQGRSRGT
jgi:hypothetical protein